MSLVAGGSVLLKRENLDEASRPIGFSGFRIFKISLWNPSRTWAEQ